MPTAAKAIILGLLIAIVGLLTSAVPLALRLEADLGLDVLFVLRGPRPAPEDVVVVSIDRESSDALGLPNDPDKWPRSLHGQLVRNLARGGARVVAFDIIFDEPRDSEQDRLFADAMREAGNVVLFEYLKSDQRTVTGTASPPTQVNIETRIPPIAEFAQAAAALAPFPLPKVPNKVSQFWLFKTGAGDVPTLPVVAFHIYALPAYPYLLPLVGDLVANSKDQSTNTIEPNQAETISSLAGQLRRRLQTEPSLLSEMHNRVRQAAAIPEAHTRWLLSRLIELHAQDTRYLDFYGPPRTVTTIPYHTVLKGLGGGSGSESRPTVAGKAVFVGFSEQLRPEQKDGFYTVFSQPDGVNLSGVEIAATAFGNLLEGRSITPLDPLLHAIVIVTWAVLASTLLFFLPAPTLIPSAALLGAVYLGAADWAFTKDGTWPPLVVPILLQLPLALLGALLWRYGDTRRERQKIREAFGHYLPGSVVDELLRSNEGVTARGRIVYGICLSTDAERYTSLSESLEPHELRTVLNRYYKTLFDPVKRRGGFVSDVVGDAMLALWAGSAPDPRLRKQACHAALDIIAAVDTSAANDVDACLPTRIGLHCGELLLGNVGAGDHYEYRAVGDIVNTATRIEGLNKQLGTRALVSREVVEGLDGIVSREVGRFRLAGKRHLLVIHELVSRTDAIDPAVREQHALFTVGLQAFRGQHWQNAIDAFETLLANFGEDGPSRYYLDLCHRLENTPPPIPWDGVVSLDQK